MRFYICIMKQKKSSKISNIIFLIAIVLLIIPQTRLPIQVFFNKMMASLVTPSEIKLDDQISLDHYDWSLKTISGDVYDFNGNNESYNHE